MLGIENAAKLPTGLCECGIADLCSHRLASRQICSSFIFGQFAKSLLILLGWLDICSVSCRIGDDGSRRRGIADSVIGMACHDDDKDDRCFSGVSVYSNPGKVRIYQPRSWFDQCVESGAGSIDLCQTLYCHGQRSMLVVCSGASEDVVLINRGLSSQVQVKGFRRNGIQTDSDKRSGTERLGSRESRPDQSIINKEQVERR